MARKPAIQSGSNPEQIPPRLALEFTAPFERALRLMEETSRHVFVTGRAGTGKSTLLQHFKETTAKRVAVLAPTGVAALNVGGQTIHSFFRFKPDVTPETAKKKLRGEGAGIYRKLDAVVIDEVSMVRADLMDCVDAFLRANGPEKDAPFGGLQMIFIGDLYQLPPVVGSAERMLFKTLYRSPYFFSARVLQGLEMEFVELEKIYRQRDDRFIDVLNAIRNRTVTEEDLALLNTRVDPDFEPPSDEYYIHLTSTNDLADRYNEEQIGKLKGRTWTSTGIVEGEFRREYLPTAAELKLKKGAQVMLLNNDAWGRWVNGSIGKITGFVKDAEAGALIRVRLNGGGTVEVAPFTWEIFRFTLKDGGLESESVGRFTQFPLRLAFAVTIHKSQGKTFERAIIDVGRGTFAPGQMYVALSRCTSLEGIVLRKPLRRQNILLDWAVVRYLTRSQYDQAAKTLSLEEKIRVLEDAIRQKRPLEMVYLKGTDVKSRRTIKPLRLGEMEYAGSPFLGLEAWCQKRRDRRVFNVEKILSLETVDAGNPDTGEKPK
ncbi:MAG: AAA family ATPase [Syntrophobacterales bacterium]|nr:AAA family ATPase [Syntrophobacterales bacterium]